MSLKHSKLVLIDQKSAQNDRIWSNFTKFVVEFVRIRSKSSNSTKFDIQIWDLEFEISKFEWIRTNSSELTWNACYWIKNIFGLQASQGFINAIQCQKVAEQYGRILKVLSDFNKLLQVWSRFIELVPACTNIKNWRILTYCISFLSSYLLPIGKI